jgi:hypothetical protein
VCQGILLRNGKGDGNADTVRLIVCPSRENAEAFVDGVNSDFSDKLKYWAFAEIIEPNRDVETCRPD